MRLVLCNCPNDSVEEMVQLILSRNLASAINVIPGVCTYEKEGEKVVFREMTMLQIHTLQQRVEEVIGTLIEAHPENLPRVVSLALFEGHAAYIDWANQYLGRD